MEWERIDPNTKRAKVHGGWIVVLYGIQKVMMQVKKNQSITVRPGMLVETEEVERPLNGLLSAVFVPDAKYEWALKPKKVVN